MGNPTAWLMIILFSIAGMGVGWLIARQFALARQAELQRQQAALVATLDAERRATTQQQEQLQNTFAHLSQQALRHNTQDFLQLATENLKQFQLGAEASLKQREQAIESLVTPIKEALEKTQHQVQSLENERREAYGSITKHLETLAQTQQLLHGETRNLVQALRRPEVRGQWGELTLKRLAELAGMVEHCDFYAQEHTLSDDGSALRPDMIVRMPGGREIVVDVKTPLDAYLSAVEASDDATRTQYIQHHTRNVRERVRELSGKAYWSQFKQSPDFVILFIPGEQFLSAALDVDRTLMEDALKQKVILATPSSLVALLRAVAYGWQQQALTENAERIRDLGTDLYKRLAVFGQHLAKLGKNLSSSVEHYNKAVGSLEMQVLPGARKFTELGISAAKPLDTLEQLEIGTRSVNVDLSHSVALDLNVPPNNTSPP